MFGDLKTLASGFYDLSMQESKLTGARPAPASTTPTPPTSAPAVAQPVALAPPTSSAVRTAEGEAAPGDVTPPVPVDQRLPALTRLALNQGATYRATVRIVIDEKGRVSSASLVESNNRVYDYLVVESVKTWRYRPATRNGVAIPYTRTVEVTVSPTAR